MTPNTTVKSPSCAHVYNQSYRARAVLGLTRMNTHAHPGLPPTPSMWMMAAARRPENADAKPAAEKAMEVLPIRRAINT